MTDRIKPAESIAHAISRKTVRAITWTGTAPAIIQFVQFLWGVVWALLGRRWEKKKEEKEEERRVTAAAAADEERWAEKTDQLTRLVEEIRADSNNLRRRIERLEAERQGVDNAKTTAINSLRRQVTEQSAEIEALHQIDLKFIETETGRIRKKKKANRTESQTTSNRTRS